MVLFSVWMAGWLGWVDPVFECPDTLPEVWETGSVDPEIVPSDSCEANRPFPSQGRATLGISRNPGHSPRADFRHTAANRGWRSRVEFRNDTLTRRQFSLESGGWKLLAGDMTDSSMPLLDPWLPRRFMPGGWAPVQGEILPASPALQGFGAGVIRNNWKAYALRSSNPVSTGRDPPWSRPWDFRHFAAGAVTNFSWPLSLHISETRISRLSVDSVAEVRLDFGLASPDARLKLKGARMDGTASGGFAFGIQLRQPFGDSGGFEFTLRQRDAGWNTIWDPAWAMPVANGDTGWGAGDYAASLRIPLATTVGQAYVEGKGWQAWNPALGTRRAGVRGEAAWREKGASILTRAAQSQYSGESGARYYRQFLLQASVGKNPEWSARVWSAGYEEAQRLGMRMEVEGGTRGFRIRPGLELTGKSGEQPEFAGFLWTRLGLGGSWTLQGQGEFFHGEFSSDDVRFNVTLHFQGKAGH